MPEGGLTEEVGDEIGNGGEEAEVLGLGGLEVQRLQDVAVVGLKLLPQHARAVAQVGAQRHEHGGHGWLGVEQSCDLRPELGVDVVG